MKPRHDGSAATILSVLCCLTFLCAWPSSAINQERRQSYALLQSPYFDATFTPTPLGTGFLLTFLDAINTSPSNKTLTYTYLATNEHNTSDAIIASSQGNLTSFSISSGNLSSAYNPFIPFVVATGNASNGANITFEYRLFNNRENVSYAGSFIIFEAGSIDFFVSISNWPFQNPNNSLAIVFSGTFSSSVDLSAANITLDSRGSIEQIYLGPQYPTSPPFISKFYENYVVDGQPVLVFNTFTALVVPATNFLIHCRFSKAGKTIFYDPDFSSLITPSGSSSGGGGDGVNTQAVEIAVPIAVGVALLVVVGIILVAIVLVLLRYTPLWERLTGRGHREAINFK